MSLSTRSLPRQKLPTPLRARRYYALHAMAKIQIPDAEWPSEERARTSKLFSPIRIGAFEALRRTWVPAMVPWRSNEDGEVTADVLDWYGRFADGRPGVLVVEATGIRDVPSGPLLRIGDDRFLPGLRQLVDTVRERSDGQTRLLIQILDFLQIRRRPERTKYIERFLDLTDRHRERIATLPGVGIDANLAEKELRQALCELPDEQLGFVLDAREWSDLQNGYRECVTDMHLPHIAELPTQLPELFAAAATRARSAGFDGVELHYAHAYTMASFLSRRNDRNDGYGGSKAERVRLPLEVFDRVRASVGNDFTVGARFLSDEIIKGGSRLDDAAYFAECFAERGMDFLSISRGGKFEDAAQPKVGQAAYPYTGTSGHECMPSVRIEEGSPFGRNLPATATIRSRVRGKGYATPVIAAGGINDFEQAEAALIREDCDVVASARQTLADPDWFRKMELGRGDEIRRCVFTNYCEGLDQKHKQVTCQLWDRDFEGSDPGQAEGTLPKRSDDGKRRLVPPSSPNLR
ncbi:MAG: 2,4-dienoyl-CoA reductase-like NADH-dependent reductase (Old Yellow Enzyme family) [Planctomycetota bacterium]|jgi:2,4-dienoyl-CoA reductase-like NADH-dependent reductase (Old Yellow Enzyme family)